MEDLIKAIVAAKLLGRPLSWVRWAAQHKVLPYYRVGRELRFSRHELFEWVARRRVPAADERGVTVSDPARSEGSENVAADSKRAGRRR